jgi:dihydroorotate dehydrogenase (NAD+) catalytic subunit
VGRLSVDLCGIRIDNPVIPASGTFGYGREFAELYDINCLGTFSIKGTTAEPRFGNPTPRIAECTAGMLNSVGLQNPGAAHVVEVELEELAGYFSKPVIANVSGFSVDDYVRAASVLATSERVGWIELNISCPNVHGGGMAFGMSPESAAEVTSAVRAAVSKPLIVKLSPNAPDIVAVARACEDSGADAVSLINTLLGMRIDIKKRRPVLARGTGGYSGPAVFPVALRMVYETSRAVGIPVIGMGGVSSCRDVIEMMMAGATAVQIGTMNLVDPFICRDIIRDLPGVMDGLGIGSITEIIGGCR